MKKQNRILINLILALLIIFPVIAFAQGTALSLRVGSLGIGLEAVQSIKPTINIRVGINYFTYSYKMKNEAVYVEYDMDINAFSISALVDWFPFKGEFHFSGGLLYNGNYTKGIGISTRTYTIGGKEYTPEKLGTLSVKVEPKLKFSPYLGLGWGNAVRADKKFGFAVDIGMIYQGSPDVTLTADGLMEPTAEQEPDVENDIKNLRFYPVISFGLTYKLNKRRN